jgi:hypothetical protein
MCMPKAPKPDPQIKIDQAQAKQAELEQLALAKDKNTEQVRRNRRLGGVRSLISGISGAGFGSNYTG